MVDASRTRQAIEDVGGGNFIHTFAQVTAGLDPIGRFNLEGIRPRHIRLRMALEGWEPQNDDGNPSRAAAGGFRDDGFNHGAFLLAQEAAARGIELTASIWDVPAWMVTNPGSERNRKIPAELYPELAESMGEWLRTARDVYGAEIAHVSFNEADIGVNVSLTPAEHASLIAEVGSRLAARGLRARWLLGDCANMAGCVDYARPIWEQPGGAAVPRSLRLPLVGRERLRPRSRRPLRLRSVDGPAHPGDRGRLGPPALAAAGPVPDLDERVAPGDRLRARPQAHRRHHAAVLADAGPRLHAERRRERLPGVAGAPADAAAAPGRVAGRRDVGDEGLVHSLGARDGGDFVLYLVNGGTADQPVAVSGLPTGSYRQVLSSAAGSDQELAPVAGGGTLRLTLPRESVTLLTTRR